MRVGREVTHQPEQLAQLRDACIRIAGRDRFLYGAKRFPGIFLRKLQVSPQCLDRTLVTRVGRFNLCQEAGNIGSLYNIFFHEFRQIVFPGLHIETKVKMLRIHLTDVKVGDISHHAHGEGGIESHLVCFGWLRCDRFEFRQPVGPEWPVVILGRQTLLLRFQEDRNHLPRLWGWLHSTKPRQRIRVRFVKFLHVLLVIAKIGPAQVGKISRLDDTAQRSLALSAELLARPGGFHRSFGLRV